MQQANDNEDGKNGEMIRLCLRTGNGNLKIDQNQPSRPNRPSDKDSHSCSNLYDISPVQGLGDFSELSNHTKVKLSDKLMLFLVLLGKDDSFKLKLEAV